MSGVWHTPQRYDSQETVGLLDRRFRVGRRYADSGERAAENARRHAGSNSKQLRKRRAGLGRALSLYERGLAHMNNVLDTLRIAQVLINQYETGRDSVERAEFYEQAMAQSMPDEFVVQLRRNTQQDEKNAFSVEGFEEIGYQMHDFVMARTVAFMAREGRPPSSVRVEMKLRWDDDRTVDELEATEMSPWYSVADPGGRLPSIDGKHRLSTFLADRHEEGE